MSTSAAAGTFKGLAWSAPLVRRWWPAALLAGGGWLLVDASLHVGHLLSSSASFTLAAAAAGALWLMRPRRPGLADTDIHGWLRRLEALEPQFEQLVASGADPARPEPCALALQPASRQRAEDLAALREQVACSVVQLAVVGLEPVPATLQLALADLLRAPAGLTLHWAEPLPRCSSTWSWPATFQACDLILHVLSTPLSAAELRWIEAMPQGQPAWLLALAAPGLRQQELLSQLPAGSEQRLLFWDGEPEALAEALRPLSDGLLQQGATWRGQTQLRQARDLHRRWQADLERLRRQRFEALQQRTQWLVAAGVFAAPLPSLDVLVLAVANGLMLQEMARIWQCPWSLEQLRSAAAELARASLALGVVEWSSQSLAGLLKLHGATWLVGGAVQALSAAYLTRVVGRAMADVLALSSGVDALDLEQLKREAPLIVARAAEEERLDWQAFLQQARQWLRDQAPATA